MRGILILCVKQVYKYLFLLLHVKVRVLGCLYVGSGKETPDTKSDPENWIIKCSSWFECYNGLLSYENAQIWKRYQMKLGICRETELLRNQKSKELQSKGLSHEPFVWHMLLTEFMEIFQYIDLHYNTDPLTTYMIDFPPSSPSSIRSSPENNSSSPPSTGKNGTPTDHNFSSGQSLYFMVDSLEPTSFVYLSFSTMQTTLPRYPGDISHTDDDQEISWCAPISNSVIRPQSGLVKVSKFCWKRNELCEELTRLRTNGTMAMQITLPSGRHTFQIQVDCDNDCCLMVSATQKLVVGEEERIWKLFQEPSSRMQASIQEISKHLQTIILDTEKRTGATQELLSVLSVSNLYYKLTQLLMITCILDRRISSGFPPSTLGTNQSRGWRKMDKRQWDKPSRNSMEQIVSNFVPRNACGTRARRHIDT